MLRRSDEGSFRGTFLRREIAKSGWHTVNPPFVAEPAWRKSASDRLGISMFIGGGYLREETTQSRVGAKGAPGQERRPVEPAAALRLGDPHASGDTKGRGCPRPFRNPAVENLRSDQAAAASPCGSITNFFAAPLSKSW